MYAYSDTDLKKFDLCKFFSVFLVFQCGASGRYSFEFGRYSLEVQTCAVPRPPNRSCCTSGRVIYFVRTIMTVTHVREAHESGRLENSVRTGDPQRL
jgi:hypothetical protein